jgi:hypothetical protein
MRETDAASWSSGTVARHADNGTQSINTATQNTIEIGTRDDLVESGTRDDLVEIGTRDDLVESGTRDDLVEIGTRDDLVEIGTRDDLVGIGTRDDLNERGTRDNLEVGARANANAKVVDATRLALVMRESHGIRRAMRGLA